MGLCDNERYPEEDAQGHIRDHNHLYPHDQNQNMNVQQSFPLRNNRNAYMSDQNRFARQPVPPQQNQYQFRLNGNMNPQNNQNIQNGHDASGQNRILNTNSVIILGGRVE